MSKCSGVIIKQSDFGEGHRMLWILTDAFGIIKAVAHGAEKVKSKSGASTQFLSFCEFDFYESGDIWNINSVKAKDTFWPIQEDIKKLALCTYFADIVFYSLELHNPDINIMRLFLNTLFGCAYKDIPLASAKLVFELKLMSLSGFMPLPDACASCGSTDIKAFDADSGEVLCGECAGKSCIALSGDMYKALYYIIHCDMKKMFSVQYPETAVSALSDAVEKYVERNIGKDISSLKYYKKL